MKKSFSKKNSGFTFLEVIVSVAMVSLIAIALSSYFSSSIKTNATARRIQRASLANQTVLEEIRANDSIQDIAKSYANALDPTRMEVIPVTGGGFIQKTPASWDGTKLNEQTTYYFVRTINIDNVDYKVLITIDGTDFNAPVGGASYNTLEFPQIRDVSNTENAIIVDNSYYDIQGKAMLQAKYEEINPVSGASYDTSIGMKRRLSVKLEDVIVSPMVPATEVKVTASYDYHNPNYPGIDSYMNLGENFYETTLLKSDFNTMYYFYNSTLGTEEDINICNDAQKKLDLYLVCQGTPDGTYKAVVTGNEINDSFMTVYSNVAVTKAGADKIPVLITYGTKQRFTKVTVQSFLGTQDLDHLTPENEITKITTTRGE